MILRACLLEKCFLARCMQDLLSFLDPTSLLLGEEEDRVTTEVLMPRRLYLKFRKLKKTPDGQMQVMGQNVCALTQPGARLYHSCMSSSCLISLRSRPLLMPLGATWVGPLLIGRQMFAISG